MSAPRPRPSAGSEAARIKAARAWASLSQEELARRLDVEVQWVKRRERLKKRQDSRRGELVAIAEACGLPIQWFKLDVAALLARIPISEQAEAEPPRRLPRAQPGEDRQQAP